MIVLEMACGRVWLPYMCSCLVTQNMVIWNYIIFTLCEFEFSSTL